MLVDGVHAGFNVDALVRIGCTGRVGAEHAGLPCREISVLSALQDKTVAPPSFLRLVPGRDLLANVGIERIEAGQLGIECTVAPIQLRLHRLARLRARVWSLALRSRLSCSVASLALKKPSTDSRLVVSALILTAIPF